ncbi:MAG TPA: 30S ribosomal protein S3, partial [Candidatus Atribacteria bacterium]|nr:30S ribosomal protein S3 [Candidatus Atribacteria bacterium]
MGQKVHPKGLRLGIVKDWDSKWFARFREKEFPTNVLEDYKIRKYLKERLYQAG